MSARPSKPTGLPSPSTTGNSLWLVRSSVSTASSIVRLGRKRRELRHHRGAHRHAARHRAHRDQLRLRGGREIDEDRDEDQQRIAEQADEAERERDDLPDRGGDFGRAHVTEPDRQQRAQHAAAIHRKRRDHVEQHEEQVHRGEPVDHAHGALVHAGEVAPSS